VLAGWIADEHERSKVHVQIVASDFRDRARFQRRNHAALDSKRPTTKRLKANDSSGTHLAAEAVGMEDQRGVGT
jgi:hypothetical protein